MNEDLKTLAEIWESADRKPVKVMEELETCILVGICGHKAFVVSDICIPSYGTRNADRKLWKLYTEPKEPKRLWPAIVRMPRDQNPYYITNTLYESIEDAKKDIVCDHIISLANADDFANGFLVED